MARKSRGAEGGEDALLQSLLEDLEKVMGGYPPPRQEWLSTGSLLLDLCLGGGWPLSKACEIFGPENEGKSMLCILACREAQKAGGRAFYIATEPDYDPSWMHTLGVVTQGTTLEKPIIPTTLEETCAIIERIVDAMHGSEKPTVIVWDSVASAGAEGDASREMDKTAAVAEEARVLSRFFRRPTLRKMYGSRVLLLMTNQLRDNVGVMFGNKETTPGGRALRHNAAVRLRVRRSTPIKKGEEEVGFFLEARVVKTKVAATTGKVARVPFFYGYGLDEALACIYYLLDAGVLAEEPKGWIRWEGKNYRKGELRDRLLEDPALLSAFRDLVEKTFLRQ